MFNHEWVYVSAHFLLHSTFLPILTLGLASGSNSGSLFAAARPTDVMITTNVKNPTSPRIKMIAKRFMEALLSTCLEFPVLDLKLENNVQDLNIKFSMRGKNCPGSL